MDDFFSRNGKRESISSSPKDERRKNSDSTSIPRGSHAPRDDHERKAALVPNDSPKPGIKNDAIEDALAKADAVILEDERAVGSAKSVPPQIDGTGSLRDVIDQVEKQLMSSLKGFDAQANAKPEELDVLDIEAELGRPDPGVEGIVNSASESKLTDDEVTTSFDVSDVAKLDGSGFVSDHFDDDDPVSGDFSSLIPLAPVEFKDPQADGWDVSRPNTMDFGSYDEPYWPESGSLGGGNSLPLDGDGGTLVSENGLRGTPPGSRAGSASESRASYELRSNRAEELRSGTEPDAFFNDNNVPTDPSLDEEDSVEMTRVLDAPTPAVPAPSYEHGLRFGSVVKSRGWLSEQPLWSLLVSALVDRHSGLLLLGRNGVERRFYLDRGDVVIATSTAREDRLVELLYREGRLSDEEYSQAVLTIGTSGRKVGAILVERGLISSRELFPLVRHHYENIILDSFSWREGTWQWILQEGYGGERILLEVPTPTLILEGIRSRAPWKDVETLVPLGGRPLKLPEALCPVEEIGLLPEEMAIYDACDGSADINQIARQFELPVREIRVLFAGLVVLEALKLESFELDGAASFEESEGVELGALTERVHSDRGFRVERMRLADKMAQAKEGTYFALLEVSPDASGYEIRKSYRALKSQFAQERYGVPELQDLLDQVSVVRHVIDEAYEVLRNLSMREAYRQCLDEDVY